jgi:hypothetical protein
LAALWGRGVAAAFPDGFRTFQVCPRTFRPLCGSLTLPLTDRRHQDGVSPMLDQGRRRRFITLAGDAVAWPPAACARESTMSVRRASVSEFG